MKQRFASDPRDSAAAELESKVQAVFREMRTPPDMLKSVLCRESLCRLEVRWRAERSTDYMTVMTRLSTEFDAKMAINPNEQQAPDGALGVDVYWQRKPAQ
jgi:crotonobetainyl-CoA:carnitine CoA-transferase CaiB-like acyl-CoA transferase